MASSSSISTYLDVTKAAEVSPDSSDQSAPIPVDQAAKVLAAVKGGTDLVTDLPTQTGLAPVQVMDLLAKMADNGLVTVDNTFHVHLTASTQDAFSAA